MQQTPIHDVPNPDILNFMRPGFTGVVEVGSSSGALAHAYRSTTPECHYVGIEIDAAYAEASRAHCQEVIYGNVEHLTEDDIARLAGRAQCWVFGDALEHLYDPWKLIERIRKYSAPGTELIACIPNVQYWGLQSVLNAGQWMYQDAGLLDRTHIRWFTRQTMMHMFMSNGFQVVDMSLRVGQQPSPQMAEAIQQMARAGGYDPQQALNDAIAFQYVMRCVAV